MSPRLMRLSCGERIDPLGDFTPRVDDIAHSLSLQCRYNGHCDRHYSVAEHSVRVALWVGSCYSDSEMRRRAMRTALMHDAAEAYLGDVPRPIKHRLSGYAAMEAHVEQVIARHFDLDPWCQYLRRADDRIIVDEMRALFPASRPVEHKTMPGLGLTIVPWSAAKARDEFLMVWRILE